MSLLSFQKPAVAACLKHIYSKERIKWNGIDIHPPAGIDASVSSGKSMMIAHLAAAVKEAANTKGNTVRILVIQTAGELADQNSSAAWNIGLNNSCYSASLGRKSVHYEVIYGTVGTVYRALDKEFETTGVDIVLADEGHQIPYDEPNSMYMKILIHLYRLKSHMRVLMFSGSWFRGADSVIGEFWQKALTIEPDDPDYPEGGMGNGKISTEWMGTNGWVVPAVFGWPELEEQDSYAADFERLVSNASGDFSEEELDAATSDIEKLFRIMAEVIARSEHRNGVLLFAATQKHTRQVKQVMIALGVDPDQIGIITDQTKKKERVDILERAKAGRCKYVLNVGVLTTGINVSRWDVLVYLRPIGSLTLLIQSIGRVLRLMLEDGSPGMVEMDSMTVEERLALIASSPKPDALILDYAGVMDRLGEQYQNPLLEQAQREHAKRKNELITCPICAEENSIHARRCIGTDYSGNRCEWFWKFNLCPDCGVKNDIVARSCRDCGRQLIDPNAALSGKHYTDSELVPVVGWELKAGAGGKFTVKYKLSDGREPYQIFYPNGGTQVQVNTKIWYSTFVKVHVPAGRFRDSAYRMKAPAAEKAAAIFNRPTHIAARFNEETKRWTIGRRKFSESGIFEVVEDEA